MKKQMMKLSVLLILVMVKVQVYGQYKLPMTSGVIEFNEIMDVEIEGYEGKEVVIETAGNYSIPERAKGLRPVNGMGLTDNTGIGLTVKEESDGQQVVYQISRNRDAKYRVKIPKGVMVKYVNSSIHGEDFHAKNISSEINVKTHGGSISLIDVTGPLTANSVHGDIDVIFATVAQDLPISVASVHGDVDVSIPSSAGADLTIKTAWGEVYSDLDINVTTADEMKVYGAKKINGKLNNGGVAMAISSTHGNVYLRKKQ